MPAAWITVLFLTGLAVKILVSWFVVRSLINTYIGSFTEAGALAALEKMLVAGYSVTSNPLGEAVRDKASIAEILRNYCRHIQELGALKRRYPDREVSIAIKPSQFGAKINQAHFAYYARYLCSVAIVKNVFVWFDAEKLEDRSLVVSALLLLVKKKRRNFGLALQSAHSDASGVLDQLVSHGIAVRIVKGAYRDGDLKNSQDISSNFLELYRQAKKNHEQPGRIAIGTCDSLILDQLNDRDIQHQFLFGVRSKLQEEYLARGRDVLIYVPWGSFKDARGFFFRRLREGIKIGMLITFVRNIFEARQFRRKYGI
ncbi:MAG: proline dehydrogenase family protein [Patescibacteria group bacterium]